MTRFVRLMLILLALFALHLFALDRVSAQDQFFDSNGVRIRYVDQGSGPPVVLIHGFSGSLDTGWVETGVLPKLAADTARATSPMTPRATGSRWARMWCGSWIT